MATWTVSTTECSDLVDLIEESSLDVDFRHAFEDAEDRSEMLRNLVQARKRQPISQADVARLMGTTLSSVSDLEGGAGDPQLSTLQRYARAVNARLSVEVGVSPIETVATATAQPWLAITADRGKWLAAVVARAELERRADTVFEESLA